MNAKKKTKSPGRLYPLAKSKVTYDEEESDENTDINNLMKNRKNHELSKQPLTKNALINQENDENDPAAISHKFTQASLDENIPRIWKERLERRESPIIKNRIGSPPRSILAVPYKGQKKSVSKLMEDLYSLQEHKTTKKLTGKKSIEKRICDQIKQALAAKSPSTAFIELYHNISAYMKRNRVKLYQKIWELELTQKLTSINMHQLFSPNRLINRRHSETSVDSAMPSVEESINNAVFQYPEELIAKDLAFKAGSRNDRNDRRTLWNQQFILQQVEKAPDAYAKLVKSICQQYENLGASSLQLEKLCGKMLRVCQPESNISGCNIHKSLFMSKILNNDLIKKVIEKAKKGAQNTKITAKCKDLHQNVFQLYHIEDEINNCRVKIKINNNENIRQGILSSFSNSEEYSESSGENQTCSRGNSRPSDCRHNTDELITSYEKPPVWKRPIDEIVDMIEGGNKTMTERKRGEEEKVGDLGYKSSKKKKNKKRKQKPKENGEIPINESNRSKIDTPSKLAPSSSRLKPNIAGEVISKMQADLALVLKQIDELIKS